MRGAMGVLSPEADSRRLGIVFGVLHCEHEWRTMKSRNNAAQQTQLQERAMSRAELVVVVG